MADLIFVAQFTCAKVGKTGLTVTVDVDRYTISDGTRTALVTAGSATEGRRGLYHYRLASADLSLYQYITTFITTNTTVDQQEIPSLGLVVPDALVGSRLATAGYTAPPSSSDNATAAAAAILVTPANKLATGASGIASANVTMQQGVSVAAADANGNVPVVLYGTQPNVTFGKITLNPGAYQPALHINSNLSNAISGATGLMVGLTSVGVAQVTDAVPDAQDIADALLLAPSGAAAAGSAMDYLADILEDTGTTLPTAIAAIEPGGGSYAGDGTGYYSDTIDDGTSPLDGVRVQLYTSPNRVGPAYEAYTNALGVFEMWPDPGTYYRWLDLAGFSFAQDVAVTVTEP